MKETVAPGAEALRTERLILRRFRMSDVDAYYELFNQPTVEATLVPGPTSKAEAGRHIAMIEGHWPLRGYSFFAVIEKSTRQLVGRVGPWYPEGWPDLEIGWTIHPRRWRRGYAAEAALASGRWLLEQLPERQHLIHAIEPSNIGSQSVAKKLGSQNTRKRIVHPVAGPLEIWQTPRAAFF